MNDYALGATIYLMFTTRAFSTGVPTALAGSPTLEIYENDNATPIVEGAGKLVLNTSWQSIVGLNLATITATSGNGFESGKEYHLIIKTGTVGGVSVVGEVVGHFSIEKSSATLKIGTPTDLGGGATLAFNLSDIEAQTDDIGTAGAGLTNINLPNQTMDITGNITGNLSGSVGSVTGAVGSVTGTVTVGTNNDKTGYALSSAGVAAIWDALTSGMTAVGSIGKKLADWVVGTIDTYTGNTKQTADVASLITTVGVAGAGLTALGDTRIANLDATVSSRSTFAGGAVASVTGAVGSVTGLTASDVGAIKTKTDSLTFTQAGHVDANVQRINDVAITGDGSVTPFGV